MYFKCLITIALRHSTMLSMHKQKQCWAGLFLYYLHKSIIKIVTVHCNCKSIIKYIFSENISPFIYHVAIFRLPRAAVGRHRRNSRARDVVSEAGSGPVARRPPLPQQYAH